MASRVSSWKISADVPNPDAVRRPMLEGRVRRLRDIDPRLPAAVSVSSEHSRKGYKVAEARARFGEVLDDAEKGIPVIIERRGVRLPGPCRTGRFSEGVQGGVRLRRSGGR